jgi:hypothetical protein
MDYYYRRISPVQYSGYLWTISTEWYHWSNSQDLYGQLVQKGITGQYSGYLWTIITEGYHRSNSQDIYELLVQKGITGPIVRISMDYY